MSHDPFKSLTSGSSVIIVDFRLILFTSIKADFAFFEQIIELTVSEGSYSFDSANYLIKFSIRRNH